VATTTDTTAGCADNCQDDADDEENRADRDEDRDGGWGRWISPPALDGYPWLSANATPSHARWILLGLTGFV